MYAPACGRSELRAAPWGRPQLYLQCLCGVAGLGVAGGERPQSHGRLCSFDPLVSDSQHNADTKVAGTKWSRRLPVGVAGFEPTASSSRTKRATKLRHTPVPFEYSHTLSIFPNGDGASARSVVHAACCLAALSPRKPESRWRRRPPMRDARAAEMPRDASRCESSRRGRFPGQPRYAATPRCRPEPPTASSPSRTGAKYRSS